MAKEVVASVSFVDLIFRGVTQAGKEKSQHFTKEAPVSMIVGRSQYRAWVRLPCEKTYCGLY